MGRNLSYLGEGVQPRHITFCLCPQFPLFCIASALEVLRHANRFSHKPVYRWSFLCEEDQPIEDSNGLFLQPSTSIELAADADMSFVVAGFDANEVRIPRLRKWLHKQARAGNVIGGISNGAFQLAKADLLIGYDATAHWEDFENFCLEYPQVRARYRRFVFDRNRVTCSGGTATLDLFIEIVRNDHGSDLALKVARQMLLHENAPLSDAGMPLIFDGSHQFSTYVQRALSLLDASIEHGLNVEQLANRVGISRRELLRLFQFEIGKAPSEVLSQRRLERAQSLILHSQLTLATISAAVGFSSQSHLTSCYRKRYGITPASYRKRHRRQHALSR